MEPTADMVGMVTADTRLAAAMQTSVSGLVNIMSVMRLDSRRTREAKKRILLELQVQLVAVGQRRSGCMRGSDCGQHPLNNRN